MNPLRSLIDRLAAWNQKPRHRSALEVARLLQDVATGTADHGKVDGFIYISIVDPTLERFRHQFGAMYGPGFQPTSPEFVALAREADAFASSEEAFLNEVDPYGDRFGTSIPWWGCLGVILLIGAIIWLIL